MELVSILFIVVGLLVGGYLLYANGKHIAQALENNQSPSAGNLIGIVIALAVIIVGFSISGSFGQIDSHTVGLQKSFGGYTGKEFTQGFYTTMPVVTSVETVDMRNQHRDLPQQIIITKDQQSIPVDASINFNLNPNPKMLVNTMQYVGQDYYDTAIQSQFIAAIKAVIGHNYTFADLNANLDKATNEIAADTERRVRQISGTDAIQIQQVSLKNIQPSDDLKAAIERKVIAIQDSATAQQNKLKVKYETDQRVIQADGDAKVQAAQARTITGPYLELQRLQVCQALAKTWNGVLAPFSSAPCGGSSNSGNASSSNGGNYIVDARDLSALISK